jgi:hypothetical protein
VDPWIDTQVNQAPVDVYTLGHFGVGALYRSVGLSFGQAVVLSLIFEHVLEPALKVARPDFFPAPSQDTPINRIMDTVAVAAGWAAANRVRRRAP